MMRRLRQLVEDVGTIAIIAGFLLFATFQDARADDTAYMGGVRYSRIAQLGVDSQKVYPTFLVETEVPAAADTFNWGIVSSVRSAANAGDNVAIYGKTAKWGYGPGFGGVYEVQDYTGIGPVWGLEVDLMSNGSPVSGYARTGIGIVLGRAEAKPWRDAGDIRRVTHGEALYILPYWPDRGYVDTNYGVRVGINCRIACISVPAGNRIALNDEGTVYFKYDPQSKTVGLYDNGEPLWQVPTKR